MKKTAIAALLVVCLCLLPGCGPEPEPEPEPSRPTSLPTGYTSTGTDFKGVEEFVEVFGEVMALPTYYPEGFDPRAPGESRLETSAYYTDEAFYNQGKEGFDRFDASNYNCMDIGVFLETEIILKTQVRSVCLRWYGGNGEDEKYENYEEYEAILNHPYGGRVRDHTKVKEDTVIKTRYGYRVHVRLEYDGTPYYFYFTHSISSNAEEGRKYDLEEELKEWTIKEATLMYESMEYWK